MTVRIPRMGSGKREFPRIEELNLCGNNSQAVVKNFLKYGCTNAQSLFIYHEALANVRRYVISATLVKANWELLTKFYICINGFPLGYIGHEEDTPENILAALRSRVQSRKHFDSSSTFLKYANFPSLRWFYLTLHLAQDVPRLKTSRVFKNIFNFLARHSQTLKTLHLGWHFEGTFPQALLPPINWEHELNVNLDSIHLEIQLDNLEFPILCGSHLKEFVLDLKVQLTQKVKLDLQNVMEANALTLETLSLTMLNDEMPIIWLKDCKELKSLTLAAQDVEFTGDESTEFPNLKKIMSVRFSVLDSPGVKRLIKENRASLQELHLHFDYFSDDTPTDWDWDWLEGCRALRYLELEVDINLDNLIGFGFTLPQVSDIMVRVHSLEETQICHCLVAATPNVEIIYLSTNFLVGVDEIQTLINSLVKLKKITLFRIDYYYNPDTNKEAFRNYVQNTVGLKFEVYEWRNPRSGELLEVWKKVFIDRSKYVQPQLT